MADKNYLIQALRDYVATNYSKELDVFDDGAGLLFFTVRENGMTDSFKMVVPYNGTTIYHVEVTNHNDQGETVFEFNNHVSMVSCYMAIFTFHKERVQSRFKDI
jgi:hypothetical protein